MGVVAQEGGSQRPLPKKLLSEVTVSGSMCWHGMLWSGHLASYGGLIMWRPQSIYYSLITTLTRPSLTGDSE